MFHNSGVSKENPQVIRNAQYKKNRENKAKLRLQDQE